VKSRRPYLLRAMHEWINDSGRTPHVVVDATVAAVQVPTQFISDGKIVLNVSWDATSDLVLGNEEITFNARFGGVGRVVRVPTEAVLAIYARETGEGMLFNEDAQPAPDDPGAGDGGGPPAPGGTGKPQLTVVK
jgi:stringent starvation protein B